MMNGLKIFYAHTDSLRTSGMVYTQLCLLTIHTIINVRHIDSSHYSKLANLFLTVTLEYEQKMQCTCILCKVEV